MSACEQLDHVGIAGSARARDEIPPGSLAQFEILHLVEFGETRGHARFDRALAQRPRAERVNGSSEEALQIRQRRPQSGDTRKIRGLARRDGARPDQLSSSARWKRPRSSDAAFRVNVTAAMCSTS